MLAATRLAVLTAILRATAVAFPLVAAASASAQAARFSRSTDTVRILGETVLGDHYTFEAVVMRESADDLASNRLFGEQLDSQEDKAFAVNGVGVSGNVWSHGCSSSGLSAGHAFPVNTWHHVALVRDGGTFKIFVDGEVAATGPATCPSVNAVGSNMAIGAAPYTAGGVVANSYLGRVDWLRVSTTARYTASFQPSLCEPDSDSSTALLMKFNDPAGTTNPIESGPSHFAASVATGFNGATAPTFGLAGAAGGATATLNQSAAAACHNAGAQFSVNVSRVVSFYQWQIETSPGQWVALGNDPVRLPCPSIAPFAYATPLNAPTVTIVVHGCSGPFNVRCVATTSCGAVTSDTARLLVNPADIGSAGGLPEPDDEYDNNDFIAFINAFFANQPTADLGAQGGLLGSDGHFDNNDFISFINLFFAGC